MLVLGLDPGTATTGYGFIKILDSSFEVTEYGLIETGKDTDPAERLLIIHDKLMSLISNYSPDVIAIERLFFASNAKTAMRVGQALGVMLLCAAKNKLEIFEYAPATIKKIITGDGRADKLLIQKHLRKVFGAKIRSKPKQRTHFDNSADAIAVALCHIYKFSNKEVI